MQVRSKVHDIDAYFASKWKQRWTQSVAATKSRAATWTTPWEQQPLNLYEGLEKHEATALFLLRTEILGLKSWLARIGVPGVSPECKCGAPHQTLTHIAGFCTDLTDQRQRLFEMTGTTNFRKLVRDRATARIAARWLLETRTLEQFSVALEVEQEEQENWAAFQVLHEVPE